jgi:hypothetical protein
VCLSCGCQRPGDSHEEYNSITVQKIYDAAVAAGIEPGDVINNIENTYALRVANQPFHDIDLFEDEDGNNV